MRQDQCVEFAALVAKYLGNGITAPVPVVNPHRPGRKPVYAVRRTPAEVVRDWRARNLAAGLRADGKPRQLAPYRKLNGLSRDRAAYQRDYRRWRKLPWNQFITEEQHES